MHNFGKIKHNIYEVVVDGIAEKDNSKKVLLKKYVSTIKESEILRAQANVYNNIESRVDKSEYIATEYIKENIALLQKFNIKDIVRENKKLSILLESYPVVDFYDKHELHENIHNLILTKKTATTINNIVESTNFIKDYILNNIIKEKVIKEEYLPNSMLIKFLSEKYNTQYSSLTEDEFKTIKMILESDNVGQEAILNEMKKNVIALINESIKSSDGIEVKGKLLDVKERLLETSYNKETFTANIIKLINLKKNLES